MKSRALKIILIDMDEVIANYSLSIKNFMKPYIGHIEKENELWPYINKNLNHEHIKTCTSPGFFRNLMVVPGAIEAVRSIKDEGYNIKFCSTPQVNSTSHSEKCDWIAEKFGIDMASNLILTHDKTLIRGDILIDDKVNIKGLKPNTEFTHILFRTPYNEHAKPEHQLNDWYDDWKTLFQKILY
jgi:5'-nucleotidase